MTDRRDAVLEAAISVLGTQGIRGLTHRAVDAAADLPMGSTSNYFRTRDSLLAAVADRVVDVERNEWEAIAATIAPRTAIELAAALGAFARAATGQHRLVTLARYALLVEGARYPPLRSSLAAGGARVNLYFENWLRRIGSRHADRDLRLMANAVTGFVLHDLAMPDPLFDPTSDLTDLIEVLVGSEVDARATGAGL